MYCSKRASCTDRPRSRESEETLLQLVLPAMYRGRLLSEDAMMRLAIWAWSACLISCVTGSSALAHGCPGKESTFRSAAHTLPLKAKQPKFPLKNIVATHPLELVHLDYLCLEPGKGLDENILVVTDHFTRYAQAYVTRTQTTQMAAKTLWDMFIIHYGLPKKILMDPGSKF